VQTAEHHFFLLLKSGCAIQLNHK